MIKISFNGLDFETDSTIKAFVWLECLEQGESVENADNLTPLIYRLWGDFQDVDILNLTSYVVDTYKDLIEIYPDDYEEIRKIVFEEVNNGGL